MAITERGRIDYDQIRAAARSGDGPLFLMFTGPYTAGNLIMINADGNAVDAGIPASALGGTGTGTGTHSEILTTASGEFIYAGGSDIIYVLGVPD
jgi:hypothetical protein